MQRKAILQIVESLRRTYQRELRLQLEDELSAGRRSVQETKISNLLTKKMMMAAEMLDGAYKTIIVEEILNNRRGCWYRDIFSPSTYGRHRYKAYEMYIKELTD